MSGSLTGRAVVLAGHCCRALGWRPADFWSATPAEIAAILHPPAPDEGAALGRDELQRLLERDADGR